MIEFANIRDVSIFQKISKFIEFTKKIKKIGIPLDYNQRQNIVLLDRWPLLFSSSFIISAKFISFFDFIFSSNSLF